ncbi:MAG: pilus assembly protein Flp/PilA [Sphingomonadales bacterium]|jgi:pilus assembly protein Flp/PilA|nr:pilus assembly protein Flp/PilA [Sphingomonadales bacterium]MEA3049544.1 pilus assembly protein Flp/PilA [Sphingomonadales bacterium]
MGKVMRTFIRKIIGDNQGATAIEYGLIAALIAVAAIAALKNVGTSLGGTFNNTSTCMKDSTTC